MATNEQLDVAGAIYARGLANRDAFYPYADQAALAAGHRPGTSAYDEAVTSTLQAWAEAAATQSPETSAATPVCTGPRVTAVGA